MEFIAVRWILRDSEPLGKVGKVYLQDILTVNGNTVESAQSDVIPGDIITVRGQSESVAGAVVLPKGGSVRGGKRPLAAVAADCADLGAAKKRKYSTKEGSPHSLQLDTDSGIIDEKASTTATPTNMDSNGASNDGNTLHGRITNLELEIGTIKTQLEEILHHIRNTLSKSELDRDVDDELDSLLSSFTLEQELEDPLAKKHQHIQHYTGIIAPHIPSSVPRPRSLSVPPSFRLMNPSQAGMNLPFLSPTTSTPLSPLSQIHGEPSVLSGACSSQSLSIPPQPAHIQQPPDQQQQQSGQLLQPQQPPDQPQQQPGQQQQQQQPPDQFLQPQQPGQLLQPQQPDQLLQPQLLQPGQQQQQQQQPPDQFLQPQQPSQLLQPQQPDQLLQPQLLQPGQQQQQQQPPDQFLQPQLPGQLLQPQQPDLQQQQPNQLLQPSQQQQPNQLLQQQQPNQVLQPQQPDQLLQQQQPVQQPIQQQRQQQPSQLLQPQQPNQQQPDQLLHPQQSGQLLQPQQPDQLIQPQQPSQQQQQPSQLLQPQQPNQLLQLQQPGQLPQPQQQQQQPGQLLQPQQPPDRPQQQLGQLLQPQQPPDRPQQQLGQLLQPQQPPDQPQQQLGQLLQPQQPPDQPQQQPGQLLQPQPLPRYQVLPGLRQAPNPQPNLLQPAQFTLSMPNVLVHIQNRDYGRIAVALARYTYYGRDVMRQSTITGSEGTRMLDPVAMVALRSDIQRLFTELSETEFELTWRKSCLNAIAAACRHLRYYKRKRDL